jgi:glutamate dehydrogenase
MSDQLCDSSSLLSPLTDLLQQRLSADMATQVTDFSSRYYQTATHEELNERSLDNLYGATLSCWQFLQNFNAEEPKVRLYNPDLEQHGWRAQHTVIEIVQNDMPFLVDSVRMALNRRGLVIHTIHNAILFTRRDDKGDLLELCDRSAEGASAESFIYLEVDRTSDDAELKAIFAALHKVLKHVHVAVSDYSEMQGRAAAMLADLEKQGEQEEIQAFLRWMLDDHFTFLGYDEIRIEGEQVMPVAGSELGIFKLDKAAASGSSLGELRDAEREFLLEPSPLMFAKDARYSLVHRPAYMDRIVLKQFDANGNVVGKIRFHGLYTSAVYSEPMHAIPVVRDKAKAVLESTGFDPRSHNGKHLLQIMNDLPRDELVLTTEEQLLEIAMGIFSLNERRKARLLVRADRCNQFMTFLYFVPRDIFSTELRLQIQDLLMKATGATGTDFTTTFSESVLARVQFVLRIDPDNPPALDMAKLEEDVVNISRDWSDELHAALTDVCGEEQGNRLLHSYRFAFTSAYREHFGPASAVYDIQRIEALSDEQPITMSFYRVLEQSSEILRFKLFVADEPLVLSDVIPVLENLGMRVVGEHPYAVRREDGRQYWMHDFTLIYQGSEPVELDEVQDVFQDAFAKIWSGGAENDEFNQLVIGANLNWREVAMLRAYSRYSQQIRFGFSQPYIAGALSSHIQVTRLLVALFRARFEPQRQGSDKVAALAGRIESSIVDALDKVANLNEDQILRRFLELIKATLRTSFFQRDADGELKDYFSFKLSPREISDIPLPRPMFEVFVYSARVEGVHLRGGKVARGGLRWSDRLEDYRTEVLGLVKAQQVKNSVIVPVGAKGGFVAKQLPTTGGREAWLNEGIASYKIFISALLDITDNLVAGEVVPPVDVVRHDEDDPYFVVAADKGTATFSDIANEIAEDRGFWLGDAFASGGSQGYDHKGMGITARGAWESVKLHFRELGLDTQSEAFSVIAVGDMAGDVFGNGMLLSEHIQMCAAFNHLHIFIDPEPDAARSWKERKRLFDLPRSSWTDYDSRLISEGGGIFPRSAKSITLTPQIQKLTGLKEKAVTPTDLISALLKAPVDLIWNGGIGTYVKASNETHEEVGDKANDLLRVNGKELRCKVVGEGGNLGLSQKARMEYALNGGRLNTDFIDNAGGVDCSDHEVNIKILLNQVVANGDMTEKQRNQLLEQMTDDVAELVLQNNYRQVQSISLAESRSLESMSEYQRYIIHMESAGKLDRALEFLPDDDVLNERKHQNKGLTRPELSVLISYSKAELKESLSHSSVPDDPYLSRELFTAFPDNLKASFSEQILAHRLKREIIGTQIANNMVNMMGINFVDRLRISTGSDDASIARAYVLARDIFNVEQLWRQIEKLDHKVDSNVQVEMMLELQHLVRRATRWFVRNRRAELDCELELERFTDELASIISKQEKVLSGAPKELWEEVCNGYQEAGVPVTLAKLLAGARSLYSSLGIIEVAAETDLTTDKVAQIYFALGEQLQLDWLSQQLNKLQVENYWQALAREAFRDDLEWQQRALVSNALTGKPKAATVTTIVDQWSEDNAWLVDRWRNVLAELKNADKKEYAMYTVALRELFDLAKSSQFSG